MWSWLQQNSNTVLALGNILLVLIWGFYLQMFYYQYRHQRKAKLIIHQAQGMHPSASCLLVNMSREAVHVECVVAQIETEQGVRKHQVTEGQRLSEEEFAAEQRVRQGPLRPGDYLLLGRFENILRGPDTSSHSVNVQQDPPLPLQDIEALELAVVAIHGPSDHPIGARRRFVVEQHQDEMRIRPENLHTEQLLSRRDKAQVRRWLSDCLALSTASERGS